MNVTPELDARFRAAALREGLVDVRYDVVESPVGELFLAATAARALPDLVHASRARTRRSPASSAPASCASPLDEVRRELDEYFEGRRRDVRPAARPAGRAVPRGGAARARPRARTAGSTPTGTSPRMVGRPKAARAVGTVMNRNPIPIVLPCHRIVGANGSLTGYAGGLDTKRALLELEGATLPLE